MIQERLLKNKDNLKTFNIKSDTVEVLEAERAIVHYISTSKIDRGRDIVDPKGMIDIDFRKSPAVWYNHGYIWNANVLPIAKSLWRKVEDKGVLAKSQFAPTEFADDVYRLHKGGFMNTWSIGFDIPKDKNGDYLEGAIEFDEKKGITYINKWDLYEYSSAPMAMNTDAGDQLKAIKELNIKSIRMKDILNETETIIDIKNKLDAFSEDILSIKLLRDELQELTLDVSDHNKAIMELTEVISKQRTILSNNLLQSIEMSGKGLSDDRIASIAKRVAGDIS